MKRASSGMLYFLNIILVATLLVGPLAGTAHVAADTYSAPPTPQDYLPTNPKERFGLTAGQTGDMFDPTNPLATINPLSAGGGLFSDERGYWPEYAALTKRAPWSRPFRGVLADWWQRLQDGWNRL
ncbi:MAG TPA: hypothetical protein PLK31_13280, partial [Chloroflexota bacterium]|nr:hypothetical protein [Chloroflexota bacterium]